MFVLRGCHLTSMVVLCCCSAVMAEPQVGDPAPNFKLKGSDGKTYELADFQGKQAVVLAWYPKAFTGGCTAECKSFRDSGAALRKYDVAFFTASCDDEETNQKFAKSLELDYPILSDPERNVAKAYGVVNEERNVPFRWTFYIGENGKILRVEKEVNTREHGNQVATTLAELNVETSP